MSRCDSFAIVANTSDDLPEPHTPVKTVRRRFGISTLTFLRLFSRAPTTRMTSCESAMWTVGEGSWRVIAPVCPRRPTSRFLNPTRSSGPGGRLSSGVRAPAALDVVVDHSGGLHERVHRGRADEAEAALAERLGRGIRLRRRGGHLGEALRAPAPGGRRERPEELVELSRAHLGHEARVRDRREDLRPLADDAGVGREALDVVVAEPGDDLGLEAGEHLAEPRTVAHVRDPRQPRLEALQAQLLVERPVAVQGPPPLLVVVAAVFGIVADPRAARDAVGSGAERRIHARQPRAALRRRRGGAGRRPRAYRTEPCGNDGAPPARGGWGLAEAAGGLLLQRLLRDRGGAGCRERGVVVGRLLLALVLGARRDGRAHVLGREAERVHEVLRVRTEPPAQAVDVRRDSARALRGEASVDEVPGQVLLDEAQPEEVAQPRQHLLRALVGDAVHGIRESLPLQQLAVGARRLDELGLVGVEERSGVFARQLRGGAEPAGDVGDHLLHAPREELVLLVGAQAELDRAGRGPEIGDRLPELAQPRAVEHLARGLADDDAGEGCGILTLELLGVVGQEPLAHELQEDVVVTLERDVDVEVLVEADQAVLG